MRLVTCSNSAPRIASVAGAPDIVAAGPGGLVPMVAALMRRYGGDWHFVAGEIGERAPRTVRLNGVPAAGAGPVGGRGVGGVPGGEPDHGRPDARRAGR
jgi:hypothetical protein